MKILLLLSVLLPLTLSTPLYKTKDAPATTIGITGIRAVGAGIGGKVGKTYTSDFTICPKDYPNSFNIECLADGAVGNVVITVGDWKPKVERLVPYFAGGNKGDDVYPLKGLPKMASVRCEPEVGDGLEVDVGFECGRNDVKPENEMMDMPEEMVKETGMPEMDKPEEMEMEEQKNPMMEEPKESEMPKEPVMDEPKEPVMEEPKEPAMEEPKEPVAEDKPKDAPSAEPSPAPSAAPSPAPKPEEPIPEEPIPEEPIPEEPIPEKPKSGKCVGKEQDGRIVMEASNAALVGGWESIEDGIEYLPGGEEKIVDPGTDVLSYEFVPSTKSKYLLTLEVQGEEVTDFNDAFVRMPTKGLTVKKAGESLEQNPKTWLKAYNNAAKRAVGAFHVDNDPHTFVTTEELTPGETTVVEIAARSTRFKIFRIILFPCNDEKNECLRDAGDYNSKTSGLTVTGCV